MAASPRDTSTSGLTTFLIRIQVLLIVGSVLAVAYLATRVGPLLQQRDELNRQIQQGSDQLERLKKEVGEMEAQRGQLQADIARLKNENQVLETDRNVLSKSLLDTGGNRTQAIVEAAVSTIRDPEKISPRIYIHVASSENYERARAAVEALQQAGFIVPSIQRVADVPRTPQLRYFRPADVKDAERAISVIGQRIPGLRAVAFGDQDLTRKTTAMRPRHLELWF
jgi:hypothetical protein